MLQDELHAKINTLCFFIIFIFLDGYYYGVMGLFHCYLSLKYYYSIIELVLCFHFIIVKVYIVLFYFSTLC